MNMPSIVKHSVHILKFELYIKSSGSRDLLLQDGRECGGDDKKVREDRFWEIIGNGM